MSQDPVRMLANNSASLSEERSLLGAQRNVDPPPGAKDDVWAAITSRLPPGGGGGGDGGAGLGVAEAVQGAVWKKVAIGFAMGLVGMGGAELASHYSKPTPVLTELPSPTAAAEPPAARPATPQPAFTITQPEQVRQQPRVESTVPAGDPLPTTPEDPAEKRKSQLADESRMLRQARAALHSGNPGGALAILNQLSTQHPKMILAQEHEALSIDALLASGGQAAARERARRFVEQNPGSPHASKMKSIADGQQSP